MKKMVYVFCALLLLTSCNNKSKINKQFHLDVINSYTPVKNQGNSQTCWAYAMLAAIETEHIMRGDSVNLSPAYVEKMVGKDRRAPKNKRGMGATLLNMLDEHGLVAYDAMRDVHTPAPKYVFMLGAQYTPREFAHSVCAPGEYISLCTTSDAPYNQWTVLNLPDNWEHNKFYNLSPDSLLYHTEQAVRLHHGICWEGDISEHGFDFKKGVADLSLINGNTSDDHCMSIVGIAENHDGKPFFIMKNSWGTDNPFLGLMVMSFDYFKKKTIAIYMTHDAYQGIKNI
jgi:hypothetical protein